MKVVWHQYPGVKADIVVMLRKLSPDISHKKPQWAGMHDTSRNLAKQVLPLGGADGDEVHPRLSIVVSFQPV